MWGVCCTGYLPFTHSLLLILTPVACDTSPYSRSQFAHWYGTYTRALDYGRGRTELEFKVCQASPPPPPLE